MAGFDSSVKLLCHFDSASTGDKPSPAATGQVITYVSNAAVSTAQYKFSPSSLLLDGIGDYCSVPDSSDWHLGTGDFTIDAWIRLSNIAVPNAIIVGHYEYHLAGMWDFRYQATGTNQGGLYFGTYGTAVVSGDFAPLVDTWYHVAVTRESGVVRFFINGVKYGGDQAYADSLNASNNPLTIGHGDASSPYQFPGFIDEVRISTGIARWTANFTPPVMPYYSKYYSSKAGALPTDNSNLTYIFVDPADYTKVATVDGIRVDQLATPTNFTVFLFKNDIPNMNIATLTWTGQTDLAASTSTVYLQAYNRTTATWVTIASDNTTAANTNLTLTGVITGLTNYLDADGEIACRVYQLA